MRSASSRLRFLLIASLLGATTACGGNGVPPIPTDAGPRDAQRPDASGPDDGGGLDAPIGDAGDVDGGGFDPGLCRADPTSDVFTLATDSLARVRDVGVAAGTTGLGVAWSARAEGAENVWLAEIPPTGAALIAAQQITTGTSLQRDPVIAPNGLGWFLAWYGNPDADFEIYAEAFEDGRIVDGGSLERLTTRAGRDDAPVLLARSDGAMAGWIETRGATMGERVPVVRSLSTTAAPTAGQHDGTTASTTVGRFVLAPRNGGLSLAWVESGGTPRALLQQLDASGVPSGTPIQLSTEPNLDGSLDLATDESGGAAVWGTSIAGSRPQVRARLLDGSGNPLASEVVITDTTTGRDATIAPIAGGYVIAYRALDGSPVLRLDFRDANLDPAATLDVVPVSASGGSVTIRTSGEGRMVVGWADVDATTTTIRAARIRCD